MSTSTILSLDGFVEVLTKAECLLNAKQQELLLTVIKTLGLYSE
jgi:hypothetical protein